MLVNRKILDYLGEKPKYKYMYDWQLQMIAAANNDIVYINKVLVNFRRHADASTATKPTSSKFGLKKELSTMLMLIVHRRALKRHIIERFSAIEEMLSALPFDTADKKTAIEMAHYQQKKGLFNMIKFSFFCVKHRNYLFHTEEKRHLVAIARALYYPVYCGYTIKNKRTAPLLLTFCNHHPIEAVVKHKNYLHFILAYSVFLDYICINDI